MGRIIGQELPEFVTLMEEIVGLVQPVMSYVHSTTKGTALGAVTTQASNAFIDTVSDALRGRGRPALANVRNLFELVVTTLDVTGSKTLDARYRDHEWVALQQAANLTFEHDFLRKKERSALLHEQRKVKRNPRTWPGRPCSTLGSPCEAGTPRPCACARPRSAAGWAPAREASYGTLAMLSSMLLMNGGITGVSGRSREHTISSWFRSTPLMAASSSSGVRG
jgi:hypothetical protein